MVGLLEPDAEDRALHAAHDGDVVTGGAHVVVTADDPAADPDADEGGEQHQGGGDHHRLTGLPDRRFRLGRRLLHDRLTGCDHRRPARGGVRRCEIVVLARNCPGQDRLGLAAVVVVDHVGDHHGDVVRSPAPQRQFDEPIGAGRDVPDLECFQDGLVPDRVRKAVGAQQVTVAFAGLAHGERRVDLMAGERPHDQRALRVAVGLLGGNPPLVDQRLDEGVVLGDLGQLAVPQQISPGVADVHQPEPVSGEQDCGQRGAHAVEVGIQLDLFGDIRIPLVHGIFELVQQITAGLVLVERHQCGDHQLGGHLAGGMPAHAVGQRQQAGTGVDRVLVVGTNQPPVATGGVTQGQGHGRNSTAVLPMCTGVPIGTRTAVVTFALSR